MAEMIVATEVAEAEFERFATSLDVDTDVSRLDDEDREKFEAQKKLIVRAVERGQLAVDEVGLPTFKPLKGEPIKFKMWTGATVMASDGLKDGQNTAKMHRMLADMTERDASTFAKLDGRDYRVVTAVFAFFFAGG